MKRRLGFPPSNLAGSPQSPLGNFLEPGVCDGRPLALMLHLCLDWGPSGAD